MQLRAIVRDDFVDAQQDPELAGVMGNVQTPLLQFPHVYFYTSAMWDLDCCQQSEKEVLLDLSRHLYPGAPRVAGRLLSGHEGMAEDLLPTDPAKIDALVTRLDALFREDKLGPLGIFGRKLFPDHRIVAAVSGCN